MDVNFNKTVIYFQVFKEHGLSPGYYTQKYSEEMDNERKKTAKKGHSCLGRSGGDWN